MITPTSLRFPCSDARELRDDSKARNLKGSQKITLNFSCTNKLYKTIYIFMVAVIGFNLLDRSF